MAKPNMWGYVTALAESRHLLFVPNMLRSRRERRLFIGIFAPDASWPRLSENLVASSGFLADFRSQNASFLLQQPSLQALQACWRPHNSLE